MADTMKQVEVLRAACCIAGIDEVVDDKERRLLERLAQHVGVGMASLNAMINRGKSDPAFYENQFRVFKTDPETTIKVLLSVAMTDGDITEKELDLLGKFAEKLDMPVDRMKQLVEQGKRKTAAQREQAALPGDDEDQQQQQQ